MSRSRKKVANTTWATGSNTEFYRERNRSTRNYNKNQLRTLIANNDIEDIDDKFIGLPNKRNPKFDPWLEPTDGQYVVWKEDDQYWGTKNRNKLLRK